MACDFCQNFRNQERWCFGVGFGALEWYLEMRLYHIILLYSATSPWSIVVTEAWVCESPSKLHSTACSV